MNIDILNKIAFPNCFVRVFYPCQQYFEIGVIFMDYFAEYIAKGHSEYAESH